MNTGQVNDGKITIGEKPFEFTDKPNFSRLKTEEEIAYWNKVNSTKKQAITPAKLEYDMNELMEIIQARGTDFLKNKKFVIDDNNRHVIQLLLLYFCQCPEFEKMQDNYGNHFSLKKGILIRSAKSGTGKTLLLKLFANSPNWKDPVKFQSFPMSKIINCRTVVSKFKELGEKIYETHIQKEVMLHPNIWVYDELGRENTEAKHFGNQSNVMKEILTERYDLLLDHQVKTHATTNIVNKQDIERLYGGFVGSRMKEMFNVIDLPGDDRRK